MSLEEELYKFTRVNCIGGNAFPIANQTTVRYNPEQFTIGSEVVVPDSGDLVYRFRCCDGRAERCPYCVIDKTNCQPIGYCFYPNPCPSEPRSRVVIG